jgi:NADH dehydrogenase (ubiquinone) Fe-S protein 1
MILRALSEEIGSPLPYDSLDEIRTRMAELAPHLVRFDFIENSGFENLSHKPQSGKSFKLNNTPLSDNVDNFYQTDSISKNSQIMARCTKELNPKKQFNFKEHVQTWMTH